MQFDQSPYFKLSVQGCRRVGAIGGRRSARNRRLKATCVSDQVAAAEPAEETARQAIERIDALCPWLVGCERAAVE